MRKGIKSQQKLDAIGSTVVNEDDPVEYLRKRYKEAASKIGGPKAIWEALSKVDEEFEGLNGLYRIQNLQAGKASPKLTAKAIRLLEAIVPTSLLTRQNLVKKN